MRQSSRVGMLCAAAATTLVSAQDTFAVTKPAAGDTVAISDESYGRATVDIEWSVPAAIADRPVMLRLMHGDSEEEMVEVEIVSSNAENNGSFAWTSYLDDIAASGCNYTILAKSWTDYAYSGYFTITNPDDGGLDPSRTCPVDVGRLRPSNGSYVPPADSNNATGNDDETRGGSGGGSEGPGGGSGGVSTTTLAVAVTVPLVVLLGIFATVMILGIRRGWFVRKQDRESASMGQGAKTYDPSYPSMQEQGKESNVRVGELHGHDRPYQSDGNAIHQLYGDDNRRV